MTIEARPAAAEFLDACFHYEKAHGMKPRKALVGRAFFARLVSECSPLLVGRASDPPSFNGVVLEVVDDA